MSENLTFSNILLHFRVSTLTLPSAIFDHGIFRYVPIAASDAWELASILLQCVHGPQPDAKERYFTNGLIVKDLYRYLPCYLMSENGDSEQNRCAFEVKILTMHGQYEAMPTAAATSLYLNDFKLCCDGANGSAASNFYGSAFFPVLIWMKAQCLWECCLLSVGESGLSVIRPVHSYQVLESIELDRVLSCRYHADSLQFRLVVGDLADHRVIILFVKHHGSEIEKQIAFYKAVSAGMVPKKQDGGARGIHGRRAKRVSRVQRRDRQSVL